MRLLKGLSTSGKAGAAPPRTNSYTQRNTHGTVLPCGRWSGAAGRRVSLSGRLVFTAVAHAASEEAVEPVAIDEERIELVEQELVSSADETPSFADLGVDRLFLPGLESCGFKLPSPIQEAAIPAILEGGNCAVQSYTGSGKTLAYLLPAMTLAFRRAEQIYSQRGKGGEGWTVQMLVIAPSQELAMQIVRAARSLLPKDARPAVQQLIGGANPFRQREALEKHRPIVVVGTPGRLCEMVRGAALHLHRCPIMILDEADQLLAPNFSEDLSHISAHAGKRLPPPGRQTVIVSATLSSTVLKKFDRWCPEARYITPAAALTPALAPDAAAAAGTAAGAAAAGPAWGWGVRGWEGPASDAAPRTKGTAGGAEGDELVPTLPPGLRHVYIVSDPRHRVDALRRCVFALNAERALVFMNWQQRLKDAQYKLEARSMPVASLHGEMGKLARQSVLEGFSRGDHRVLLVSDVAARGLDLPGVDAVFNLELPSNAAHYAHRAGRTARMGATGLVVSVAAPEERFVMERLAARLGVPITEAHVEGGEFIIGPPPPPPKRKKDRKPSKDADARADAAPDGGAQKAPEKAGRAGAASGGKAKPSRAAKAYADDEDEYEEIIEDNDGEDDSPATRMRVEEARKKLDPKLLAELDNFIQNERGPGSGAGGSSSSSAAGGRSAGGRAKGGDGGGGGSRGNRGKAEAGGSRGGGGRRPAERGPR